MTDSSIFRAMTLAGIMTKSQVNMNLKALFSVIAVSIVRVKRLISVLFCDKTI